MSSLSSAARSVLLANSEVTSIPSLRRSAHLYSQGQPADSLYVIEEGLVKLTRANGFKNRIILAICGAGHVVGEECLTLKEPTYYSHAEVLESASVLRVPKQTVANLIASDPQFALLLTARIVDQKRAFAQKIELLCLQDVEYRILFYLAELCALVPAETEGGGHQLPITQLELADLVGATRETTSTTLNQLERRGLLKLSRRLMTISSPQKLLETAAGRAGDREAELLSARAHNLASA